MPSAKPTNSAACSTRPARAARGTRATDWSRLQEPLFTPAYEAALRRAGVQAGTRYLDVGCGAGLAAHMAAALGASVCGLDASDALLQVARTRTPAAEFRTGDIEQLPYDDASFDVITGFNSFQYAGNPVRALREARRVLRKSGRVIVMTWGRPEGMPAAQLLAALRPLLPPAPAGAPGPFALSDETTLRGFATEGGLQVLEVFDTETPWVYPDLATALRALKSSGVAARAVEQSGEAAVDQAHASVFANHRLPDGSYRISATFRSLLASA
jgi:ubiquinone/menaquinone biosynthesis C-methylase UbiE